MYLPSKLLWRGTSRQPQKVFFLDQSQTRWSSPNQEGTYYFQRSRCFILKLLQIHNWRQLIARITAIATQDAF